MIVISELLSEFRPNLSHNSKRVYVSHISNLLPISSFNSRVEMGQYIRDNLKELIQKIEESKSPSTRSFKLNTLIIFTMGLLGEDSDEYKKLSELRDKANHEYVDSNKKVSKKYELNAITDEQYEKVLNTLQQKAMVLMKNKSTNFKEVDEVQLWFILLVYFKHAFRSDLANMRVFYGKKSPEDDEDTNYLWIKSPKKLFFIFKEYKTKKSYETVIVPVHKNILNGVIKYAKFIKDVRPDNNTLLVNKKGKGLTPNAIGNKFTNFWQDVYGKNFTITLNRKRVVTNSDAMVQYKDAKKKIEKLASSMMTSKDTLEKVYNQAK